MADFRVGSGSFFDRGIEDITYTGDAQAIGLPEQSDLTPAGRVQGQHLEELLALPNMDSFLEETVRPQVDDRDLLMPGRFRDVMDEVLAMLHQAAEAAEGKDQDGVKVLNRAIRLLNDEIDQRTLIQMYRSTLYQG